MLGTTASEAFRLTTLPLTENAAGSIAASADRRGMVTTSGWCPWVDPGETTA